MNANPTLIIYARGWMCAHPEISEAAVVVVSMTPKGKNGRRGLTAKRTWFFIRDGRCAMTRRQAWANDDPHRYEPHWNGVCHICGHVFTDTAIRMGWADDPDAGQPIPRPEGSPNRRAAKASVAACPHCVAEHHLIVDHGLSALNTWDQDTGAYTWTREHPTLDRYPGYHNAPVVVTIDTCRDAAHPTIMVETRPPCSESPKEETRC